MKWIETAGGPFVLVALDDVSLWSGYKGDYQKACEVDGVVGIVGFGSPGYQRTALVLWDEPLRTAYMPEHQTFVQWLYADSEGEMVEMVNSRILSAAWKEGPSIEVCGTAALFDASIPGAELTSVDFIEIQLERGVCRVQTADIEPGGRQAARVHQLVPEKQVL